MMVRWCNWATVRYASAALVVAAGVACAPRAETVESTGAAFQRNSANMAHTGLGAFLAGRMAQSDGDGGAAADYYAAALMRDPENTELMQRSFTLSLAEGRLAAALPLAKRLQDLDSDAVMPSVVLGLAAAKAGDFAAAAQSFESLPPRGLNGLIGPLLAGWAHFGAKQTEAALAALKPLDEAKAFAPVQAYHSGLMLDLAGRQGQALEHLTQALSGQLSIRGIEAAGSLHQRLGQMDQAKDLYDRYLGEHPDSMLFDGAAVLKTGKAAPYSVGNAVHGMAEALFDAANIMRQGNGRDAATVFTRLALYMRPDFPLAQAVLADMLSGQDRLADANAIYQGIAAPSAVYNYGRMRSAVNLEDMGKTDEALALLDQVIKERPDQIDPLVARGDVQRRLKRYDSAAQSYGAAIRLAGDDLGAQHWPLLYSRGMCLERIKDWVGAEADFRHALDLKPDQPDVMNYLGYTWVDRGVNLEEGRAMIEKAAQLRPRDGAIVDSLGWALYRLGDYHGAVKQLERAVELKAEDPTINDHLGDAYWQVGRISEAQFQWNRAMNLKPEPEQIAPLTEKLRTGAVPAPPKAQ